MAQQPLPIYPVRVLAMVKGFRCADGSTVDEIGQTLWGGEVDTTVANCLAWYAGETVAYRYSDWCEED